MNNLEIASQKKIDAEKTNIQVGCTVGSDEGAGKVKSISGDFVYVAFFDDNSEETDPIVVTKNTLTVIGRPSD